MPRTRKTAVAKTGLAGLPATVRDRIAAKQERFASREKASSGKQLSIRGNKFRFEGVDLGNEIDVIILDYVFVNQWFNVDYDPDSVTPPACFAIADEETELAPVEGTSDRQGDDDGKCVGCWANQYGSADRGTGKACQNRRRVAVISAEYFGEEGFSDMLVPENVGYLTMGGTSLNAWRAYTNRLGKTLNVAPFQIVTTLSFDSDVDYPKLEFTAKDQIEEPEILEILVDVTDAIEDELRAVPDFTATEEPAFEGGKRAKKKAASKKTAAKRAPAASKKKASSTRRSKFS